MTPSSSSSATRTLADIDIEVAFDGDAGDSMAPVEVSIAADQPIHWIEDRYGAVRGVIVPADLTLDPGRSVDVVLRSGDRTALGRALVAFVREPGSAVDDAGMLTGLSFDDDADAALDFLAKARELHVALPFPADANVAFELFVEPPPCSERVPSLHLELDGNVPLVPRRQAENTDTTPDPIVGQRIVA